MAYLKLKISIDKSNPCGISIADQAVENEFLRDLEPLLQKHNLSLLEKSLTAPYYPPKEWINMLPTDEKKKLIGEITLSIPPEPDISRSIKLLKRIRG